MGAAELIDGIVDALVAKINANLTTLGLGGVEERSEDPAVMDKVRTLGSYAYVIPLAEGRDRMDVMQGSPGKEMYHNFSINVTAYYDQTALTMSSGELTTPLRLTRGYAYKLTDLFNGDDNQLGLGYVFRFELEQGYYEIVDRIIYTYNVKFFIKSLEA